VVRGISSTTRTYRGRSRRCRPADRVGVEAGVVAQHDGGGHGGRAVGLVDRVGDREAHAVDGAERVLDGDRWGGSVRVADEGLHAADEPVVAVFVDGEQVAGRQPRIPTFEQCPQRLVRVGAVARAEPGQQHADLAGPALDGEPVGAFHEPAGGDVVAGDLQPGAARQGSTERTHLVTRDVDQDRIALRGGVELEHLRRGEPLLDPLPQPSWHARADEEPDGVVGVAAGGRRLDHVGGHRPRVGDGGGAVAADLRPERLGIEAGGHRQSRPTGERSADAGEQGGGVVDGGEAEHGVGPVHGGRCRRAEGRQRPPAVGDAVDPGPLAAAGEQDEREVLGPPGIGLVPRGQRNGVGVDRLHVVDRRTEVAWPPAAAQDVDPYALDCGGLLAVLGVGDDAAHPSQRDLAGQRTVGSQQHRHRTEPVEGGHDAQCARTGVHEDADVGAAADTDLDEPADDVVDPLVGGGVGVAATLEEEGGVLRGLGGLLGEHGAERDAGRGPEPVDAVEPSELGERISGHVARHPQTSTGTDGRRPAQPGGDVGGQVHAQLEVALLAHGRLVLGKQRVDGGRTLVAARPGLEPADPLDDRGPRRLDRARADDQPEVAGVQRGLVDVGRGSSAGDGSHDGRRCDVVAGADEAQDWAVDVGQGHRLPVDHEAA
jgi:hypothetical protein